MIPELLIPFQYEYMQKAIYVSALIGGICGLLSCFMILKGWSLLGDALSHSIVPGVVIAHIAGFPLVIGAFVAGLIATGLIGWMKTKTTLIRDDAMIGIVFTSFFALGILLISLYPSSLPLKTIVMGNMLGISNDDIRQMVIISLVTLLVVLLKWRDLFLFCFDPSQARALGIPVKFLHFLLLSLLSATTVAALQTVGVCLVMAMLITPGATAYLLTDRFSRMMGFAAGMGIATSFLGAYLSYFLNGSIGGCIVVLQTILFLCAWIFAPKHGLLASRRRRLFHQKPWGTLEKTEVPL